MRVQYPPNSNVLVELDIEHEVRVALQRPAAEPRQGERACIAGRACGGTAADGLVSGLEGIDEAERDIGTGFPDVVIDGGLYIATRELPRDLRFVLTQIWLCGPES